MTRTKVLIVIPSRWSSRRLPGKPLIKIAGKYLLEWVIEVALKVRNADGIVVATDNDQIAEFASKFKVDVLLTSSEHQNGTERLIEVSKKKSADFYVNLQGDEPLINPYDVELLIDNLRELGSGIVTLAHKINSVEAKDYSRVKIIYNSNKEAIYFSRKKIPYGAEIYLQHIGIYGFCKKNLSIISNLSASYLEEVENLEQLRWIESGLKINVITTESKSIGVDTLDDVAAVEESIKLTNLKVIFSDVDGVLTDGKIWYGKNGEELKGFNSKDGLAIKHLQSKGIEFCLISARDSGPLRKRIEDLGLRHFVLGQSDKILGCKKILEKLNIKKDYAAYIGDDNLDIEAMNYCGWSFTVSDAVTPVIDTAKTVLTSAGGQGVIREVLDYINKFRKL